MRSAGVLAALGLALAACGPEPPKTSPEPRARVDAATVWCKERVGPRGTPTPTALRDDPVARGAAPAPELAAEPRLRVQCRREIGELLAARRSQMLAVRRVDAGVRGATTF